MSSRITLAAAGDAILTRRLWAGEGNGPSALVERVREADVSLVNLEVLLHDYEGYPAESSGGTYMRAPPWVADELTRAGFDAFAAATNHAGDYSHGGMEATMRALEERSIPYAGLGRTLADARAPAYVDSPAGRVAVVSTCSTLTPGDRAGRQRPDLQGRPGVSPLSLETRYVVDEETHDLLADLSETLGLEAVRERAADLGFPVPGEDDDGLTLVNAGRGDDLTFVVGDDPGVRQTPDESDREDVLAQIRAADRQAEFVVASLHAHEGEGAFRNDESVPDWLETFARDCIDAGADAFVGHGPHVLRGVEVYESAPIFYSLGNFAMENETVERLPADIYERYDLDSLRAQPADLFDARVYDEDGDAAGFLADRAFWETVLPVCTFDEDGLERVEFLPVDLCRDDPRGRRGEPRPAEADAASRIFDRLADLSSPYGTEVEVEDGVGVLRP